MKMRGNRHVVTIGGQTFWVDSNQEEALIRWLEENGFSERWRRLDMGLNVGQNNYTPDLELSIQYNGMTHRALVESKPYLAAFTPYVSRRMRGVARHYFCEMLLLFVHDEWKWYRVDLKTGQLSEWDVLVPGDIPIKKLYKPFTVRARSVRYHRYRKKPEIGKWTAGQFADSLEFAIRALFSPRKRRYRRKR